MQQAIVDREEQGESLSRLLPDGIAARLRAGGHALGETERLEVTVLMSDIRGYSAIAEVTDPSALAGQLNAHRAAMNDAIHAVGGTVMQFVGDAVMAVFGAPEPSTDHADRAVAAAAGMHLAQASVNDVFVDQHLQPFGLGIGLSTGEVAAAILGSEDRVEYSLVGDTVNLSARLQQWAAAGETVLSGPTMSALRSPVDAVELPPATVKGRTQTVQRLQDRRSGGERMSTDPRQQEATLPLPNALAYVITWVAVLSTVGLPFALAAGDLSLADAVGDYYLQSSAFFAVLGSLILWRRRGHAIGWVLVAIGGFDSLTRLRGPVRAVRPGRHRRLSRVSDGRALAVLDLGSLDGRDHDLAAAALS